MNKRAANENETETKQTETRNATRTNSNFSSHYTHTLDLRSGAGVHEGNATRHFDERATITNLWNADRQEIKRYPRTIHDRVYVCTEPGDTFGGTVRVYVYTKIHVYITLVKLVVKEEKKENPDPIHHMYMLHMSINILTLGSSVSYFETLVCMDDLNSSS